MLSARSSKPTRLSQGRPSLLFKPAVLDNGVRILVPPHIESGTRVAGTRPNAPISSVKD
ncbi:hypothetical protein [Thalassospira alkalitolerans]|uniref:hypothetical protein n=1 Tax=Thalassospira alkalitolerans TaxID=1293890 RepID=UPI003AA8EB0C